MYTHYIYDLPFKPYETTFNSNKYLYSPTKKNMNSEIKKMIRENSKQLSAPNPFDYIISPEKKNNDNLPLFFSHWTKHLKFEESLSKMEILTQTLNKKEEIFSWILKNVMIYNTSQILWQTSFLKSFFLSIMQSVYSSTSTVSSLSNYSARPDRQSKESSHINNEGNVNGTPKNTKSSKKTKPINSSGGGNLVQVFEKDSATYKKKEISGVVFIWGQNMEGNLGVFDGEEDQNNTNPNFDKKLKIMNPRILLPLKNTIIKTVACGYTHSIAITVNQNVLAWGSNKSCQLGLGPNTPPNVTIPTQIPRLEHIIQVKFKYLLNKLIKGFLWP